MATDAGRRSLAGQLRRVNARFWLPVCGHTIPAIISCRHPGLGGYRAEMAYMDLVDCHRGGGAHNPVGDSLRAGEKSCTCSVATAGLPLLVPVLARLLSPWCYRGPALRAQWLVGIALHGGVN